MKLMERISWLMGTVQQSLFPHLDECLPVPLTEREKLRNDAIAASRKSSAAEASWFADLKRS
jgi:hypothetical protein